MIKIRRIFGMTVVTGSDYELERLGALSGTKLAAGDAVCKLPAFYHVHRNPIRKALIKHIVDQDEGRKDV